jgi:hypothetical protein
MKLGKIVLIEIDWHLARITLTRDQLVRTILFASPFIGAPLLPLAIWGVRAILGLPGTGMSADR